MAEEDFGRPPVEAFYTVTDPEQARLLSNPQSFRFFEPFLARERSVTAAAAEVSCGLDTMLYRVRTLLKAGLLRVSRTEKRAGRPTKHYRSVHDAYFIPFEVTPFAEVEERLMAQSRERLELFVPRVAQVLRQSGHEGRRVFRRLDDGEVWQESAGGAQPSFDLYNAESYRAFLKNYRGPSAGFMDDTVDLTEAEARELLVELYGVWRRFKSKEKQTSSKPYFFQFVLAPPLP